LKCLPDVDSHLPSERRSTNWLITRFEIPVEQAERDVLTRLDRGGQRREPGCRRIAQRTQPQFTVARRHVDVPDLAGEIRQ